MDDGRPLPVPGAPPLGKAALRSDLLARRAARPAEERAAAGAPLRDRVLALPELAQPARTVAAYVAVGGEPPTADLLAALAGRGHHLLLPVLLPDGDLDWAMAGGLRPGPRGLLEPTGPRLGPAAVAGADVVVVPGLAAGRDGVRMGRGGGSYDRALTRTGALRVLLLWDGELLDRVPAEPHDQRVDVVVTPTRTVRLPMRDESDKP